MGEARFPATVVMAAPRGFCAGVVRAIDIVEQALDAVGLPLYVRKEIVHNRHVVEGFVSRGVVFVDELTEVPPGSTVIFSAHGVSPAVRAEATARRLTVVDATCPLVTKVHLEALRFARLGFHIILIGHANHEEVEGTLGEAASKISLVSDVEGARGVEVPDPERVAFLTQTTLSIEDTRPIVEELRRRFPAIQGPARADICSATQNRQLAERAIAKEAPVILVVGSNRLVEEAELAGARAYLVDDVSQIDPAWLDGCPAVGVTSGASAPELLVKEIVDRLKGWGATSVREVEVVSEDVFFPPPPELALLKRGAAPAAAAAAADWETAPAR